MNFMIKYPVQVFEMAQLLHLKNSRNKLGLKVHNACNFIKKETLTEVFCCKFC